MILWFHGFMDLRLYVSWLYDLGDGSFIYSADGSHAYDPEGEYEVLLIVIDESGCTDTARVTVPIYHGPLVPSAFTPNGDGHNDLVMLLGGNFESVDFKIYNNWGEEIFATNEVDSQKKISKLLQLDTVFFIFDSLIY